MFIRCNRRLAQCEISHKQRVSHAANFHLIRVVRFHQGICNSVHHWDGRIGSMKGGYIAWGARPDNNDVDDVICMKVITLLSVSKR